MRDNIGEFATDVMTVLVRQNQHIVPTSVPTMEIPRIEESAIVATPTFFTPKVLFIVLGGMLLLLVGVVIKVALRPESS